MKHNINNIEMFSKYYIKENKVYSKKTNKELKKDKNNLYRMSDDINKVRKVKIDTLLQHNLKDYNSINNLPNEKWKRIENNINNIFNYSVSNYGRIKRHGNYYMIEKLVTPHNHKQGYKIVKINYKHHSVHRLVYEYFGNDFNQDYHIHHIDGNKQNNHINNLQCISPTEHNNLHHKDETINNFKRGKSLTDNERKNIYKLYTEKGFTQEELSNIYNVSRITINRNIKRFK